MAYILTKSGFENLKKEIKKTEKELKKILSSKGEAAEVGGNVWHDNFAFEQLCREEQMLSKKLAELRERLAAARVIEDEELLKSSAEVRLGSKVILQYENGTQREFTISDPETADPSKGLISYQSPMGAALLGAVKDEERSFAIGDKVIKIKIIKLQ